MERKQILIVNDDGINAPGIERLARAAAQFGDVTVAAPDRQNSAASHRLTFGRPMDVERVDYSVEGVTAYSCGGSPADCVRIGMRLMQKRPDAVLSGINRGYNIASDVQYSGTAAAALEGAFQGVLSIALSEDVGDCHEVADRFIPELLKEYMDRPLEGQRIWNINFPTCRLSECKGVKRDCLMSYDRTFDEEYRVEVIDDRHCRVTGLNLDRVPCSPDTDIEALDANYIAVGIVNNIS